MVKGKDSELKEGKPAKAKREPIKVASNKSVAVCAIPAGDPYIEGVVRHYMATAKKPQINPTARPVIFRQDDPAAITALDNYRVRCAGACDAARTAEIEAAIERFDPGRLKRKKEKPAPPAVR
jgi:hypothetical protein